MSRASLAIALCVIAGVFAEPAQAGTRSRSAPARKRTARGTKRVQGKTTGRRASPLKKAVRRETYEPELRKLAAENPMWTTKQAEQYMTSKTGRYWDSTLLKKAGWPSRAVRDKGVATDIDALWGQSNDDIETLTDAVRVIARSYPGMSKEVLRRVGRNDARIQKRLADLKRPETPEVGTLSLKTLREIGLGRWDLERALRDPGSATRAHWYGRIVEHERATQGELSERDLLTAPKDLAAVVELVYEQTGARTLPLSQVEEVLPAALAIGATREKGTTKSLRNQLFRQIGQEAVERLSKAYEAEVLLGAVSAKSFAQSYRVYPKWKKLRELTRGFPPPRKARKRNGADEPVVRDEVSAGANSWHEARKKWPHGYLNQKTANAAASLAAQLYDADPWILREDIVEAFNADAALVEEHGPLSKERYSELQQHTKKKFPQLIWGKETKRRKRQKVLALLRDEPVTHESERVFMIRLGQLYPRARAWSTLKNLGIRWDAERRKAGFVGPMRTPRESPTAGTSRVYAERTTVPIKKLFYLAGLMSPEASNAQLLAICNELLVERGLSPYSAKSANMSSHPVPVEAKQGREAARRRRYWDRAARQPVGTRAQQLELAELSQFLRVPHRLPLIDALVTRLGGKKPLRGASMLWVGHMQATSYALARGWQAAGLAAADTVIVGTPYGSHDAVVESLGGVGFHDVVVPGRHGYREAVEEAVDRVIAIHKEKGKRKPIVVVDDGGLVADVLHSNPDKYEQYLPYFRIAEQTTRGLDRAGQQRGPVPIIALARARAKKLEARILGPAVADKVLQALRRLGNDDLTDKTVVVGGGGGWMGAAISEAVRSRGARVVVVENSTRRRKRMEKKGFEVATKEEALPQADFVLGASGQEWLSLADMRIIKNGAIIASASSKRIEFAMEALTDAAARSFEVPSTNQLIDLPVVRYQLGNKWLTVLGDGWPINFDGDVEVTRRELIQLTRGLLFAGAIQAARLQTRFKRRQRLLKFDKRTDDWIVETFQSLRRRKWTSPAPDPDAWRDVVDDVAQVADRVLKTVPRRRKKR